MKMQNRRQAEENGGGEVARFFFDLGLDFFGEAIPIWLFVFVLGVFAVWASVVCIGKLLGQD
jgi:hypothetical protein